DRHVAGAAQSAGVEHALKVGQHAGRAVTRDEDAVHEVRAGQVQGGGGDGGGPVLEQAGGLRAEELLDLAELHRHGRIFSVVATRCATGSRSAGWWSPISSSAGGSPRPGRRMPSRRSRTREPATPPSSWARRSAGSWPGGPARTAPTSNRRSPPPWWS